MLSIYCNFAGNIDDWLTGFSQSSDTFLTLTPNSCYLQDIAVLNSELKEMSTKYKYIVDLYKQPLCCSRGNSYVLMRSGMIFKIKMVLNPSSDII